MVSAIGGKWATKTDAEFINVGKLAKNGVASLPPKYGNPTGNLTKNANNSKGVLYLVNKIIVTTDRKFGWAFRKHTSVC